MESSSDITAGGKFEVGSFAWRRLSSAEAIRHAERDEATAMNSERGRRSAQPPVAADAEEIDAWAAREHKRRAAWLAGPSEEEKQDWARRYRWRATLGLDESRLGPTPEDVELWAEREHKRRAAWLAGPTDAEKRTLGESRSGASTRAPVRAPPSDEAESRRGRRARSSGARSGSPVHRRTKSSDWAERQSGGFLDDLLSLPSNAGVADLPEAAQRFLREAELAGKGDRLRPVAGAPQAVVLPRSRRKSL